MGVGFDEMFDALGAVQRRRVLVGLLESPDDSLRGLMDPGAEPGTETEFTGDTVSMTHVHLPKLEDYGFVDWDEDADVVQAGERFDEIEPLLGLLDENQELISNDWV
jgi:hypothetical protein